MIVRKMVCLGGVCELFTKSQEEHATIRWKTNWNSFEEEGNLLEDIEAEFEYVSLSLYELIPDTVKNKIIQLEHRIEKKIDFSTGTIIKISNLRDEWTNNQIERIKKSMEFLIPPKEQDEFYICQQKSIDSGYELIENNFSDEFDYKIKSVFDGENFMINLYRNEFDVDKIPENVFREERFMRYPYRKEDFKVKCLEFTYSISQLFNTSDSEYIERIKQIELPKWESQYEKLYTDSEDCLKRLSRNYEIGIIANQPLGTSERLENLGVRKYIDLVIASAEEGVSKPDRRIFEIALERSGCKPENAVMIGDRIDNDIVPAKQLGMKTIWIKQGFGSLWTVMEESEKADIEVNNLSDILNYL